MHLKNIAIVAAILVAEVSCARACHAVEIFAQAEYPDHVVILLSDTQLAAGEGTCYVAVSLSPTNKDDRVPGCWEVTGAQTIKVTYLLSDNTDWVEEYPRSDFQLTPYGSKLLTKYLPQRSSM